MEGVQRQEQEPPGPLGDTGQAMANNEKPTGPPEPKMDQKEDSGAARDITAAAGDGSLNLSLPFLEDIF